MSDDAEVSWTDVVNLVLIVMSMFFVGLFLWLIGVLQITGVTQALAVLIIVALGTVIFEMAKYKKLKKHSE